MIHHADGVDGANRRMAAADAYLSGYGIATECGIGRVHTTDEVETIFDIHATLTAPER